MFFKLSNQPQGNFTSHYRLGSLVLSTDAGWHNIETESHVFVYKGYVEDADWCDAMLANMHDHQYLGNFLCFRFDRATRMIEILGNRWRGVTMWYKQNFWLSNLDKEADPLWNDSVITVDQDLVCNTKPLDIIGEVYEGCHDANRVVGAVNQILHDRTVGFLNHNRLPIKVFCSGGIDSTLVWSYVAKHTANYELVLENRVQWDRFWCMNRRKITSLFWGYTQIHHWLEPCVLTSGAPGDEFMMRGPTTVNLWCMYHGLDIFDVLHNRECLHHDYYMQDKHQKLFRQQQQDRSLDSVMRLDRNEFIRYICNINANDCQHWHLGNTLTFTPLRDMRILKLMLALPVDDLLTQILDSAISKRLIAGNDQNLLSMLSDTKNVGESFSNLAQLISR